MPEITDDEIDELNFLGCLYAVGVDNWQGYEEAQEMYENTFKSATRSVDSV